MLTKLPGYSLPGKPWNGIGSIVADNLHLENIGFKGQEAFFSYQLSGTTTVNAPASKDNGTEMKRECL